MNRHFAPFAVAFVFGALFYTSGSLLAISATQLPSNWIVTGEHNENYTVDVEDNAIHLAGVQRSTGFATAMQMISSDRYAGGKVMFSADVKSAFTDGWAGMWVRIDGQNGKILAFDNMHERPITGVKGWANYSVTLPVDESATDVAFGILLTGKGQVWVKNLAFRAAGKSKGRGPEPNLNFESP